MHKNEKLIKNSPVREASRFFERRKLTSANDVDDLNTNQQRALKVATIRDPHSTSHSFARDKIAQCKSRDGHSTVR